MTTADWNRLSRLRLAALADAPDAFGSTLAEAEAFAADDWRKQLAALATFVAILDERDLGMARGVAHDTDPECAFLISMWVAPEARGRGAGEGLVLAVADWARSAGFKRLLLDVADNNAPAVALYQRMGFQSTGETGSLPPPRTHIREHRRALKL